MGDSQSEPRGARQYFTGNTVAVLLGVSDVTVRRWRVKNKRAGKIVYGPPYEMHGRDVVYPVDQFREWSARAEMVGGVLHTPAPAKARMDLIDEHEQLADTR